MSVCHQLAGCVTRGASSLLFLCVDARSCQDDDGRHNALGPRHRPGSLAEAEARAAREAAEDAADAAGREKKHGKDYGKDHGKGHKVRHGKHKEGDAAHTEGESMEMPRVTKTAGKHGKPKEHRKHGTRGDGGGDDQHEGPVEGGRLGGGGGGEVEGGGEDEDGGKPGSLAVEEMTLLVEPFLEKALQPEVNPRKDVVPQMRQAKVRLAATVGWW